MGTCPLGGPLRREVLRSQMKAGQSIFYDASGNSNWFWATYSSWEPQTFEVFGRFARDKVVLDIGAWIGPTALWEAQVARKVVALEPTRAAFAQLCRNLAANPGVAGRVTALQAALDAEDRAVTISNRGDSMDRFLSEIRVRALSIRTLLAEHPELEETGFVKLDTEGYERVLVPALQGFFRAKRPALYISLHPMYISHAQVQGVVDKLAETFPYLYEADMTTQFSTKRSTYATGDHGGTDVVCTWEPL